MRDRDTSDLYGDELAPWFHLLTPPAEYADEAAFALGLMREHVVGPLETALELGSGGGNMASHLKRWLQLTLTDVSPAMLAVSATINPECEHLVGDMRTLRLGRTFDAVLIHDAICYMTSEADLRAALATAAEHLRPGGVAVFAPDHVRETLRSRHRPWRRGRPADGRRSAGTGPPLSRMGDRSRPIRHDLPGRVRDPDPRRRRHGARPPRPAHRGPLPAGDVALAPGGCRPAGRRGRRPGRPGHLRRDAPRSLSRFRRRGWGG